MKSDRFLPLIYIHEPQKVVIFRDDRWLQTTSLYSSRKPSPAEISHSPHFAINVVCMRISSCVAVDSLTQQGDDDDNDDGLCFVNFYPTLNMAVIVKRMPSLECGSK